MQDPTAFPPLKSHFPEQEQLKCPRCDSTNTKFCYFNNYNLSQPRHFCKNCRRYWTKGGALRNIPVGGGSRKNSKKSSSKKGPSSSPSSSSSPSTTSLVAASTRQTTFPDPDLIRIRSNPIDQEKRLLDVSGSFSSLLATNGHFGSLLDGLNPDGSGMKMMPINEMADNLDSGSSLNSLSGRNTGTFQMQSNNHSENILGIQTGDSSCWNNGNTWSGLAIYTSDSSLSVEAERGKGNYFV